MSDEMRNDGKFKPIEFDSDPEKRSGQIRNLERECERPEFVIDCLERHQRWRRGIGEYGWDEHPDRNIPMPYCPRALTIIEDAAIRYLNEYAKAKSHYDECVWMKLVCGNNPWK